MTIHRSRFRNVGQRLRTPTLSAADLVLVAQLQGRELRPMAALPPVPLQRLAPAHAPGSIAFSLLGGFVYAARGHSHG